MYAAPWLCCPPAVGAGGFWLRSCMALPGALAGCMQVAAAAAISPAVPAGGGACHEPAPQHSVFLPRHSVDPLDSLCSCSVAVPTPLGAFLCLLKGTCSLLASCGTSCLLRTSPRPPSRMQQGRRGELWVRGWFPAPMSLVAVPVRGGGRGPACSAWAQATGLLLGSCPSGPALGLG